MKNNDTLKKKIAVIIIISIALLIIVFLCNGYIFNSNSVENSDKAIQNKTSRDDVFYINYDSKSKIKSGSNVRVGDLIKYKASYVNSSTSQVNTVVYINLSVGLSYVKNSSSVGEPIITSNSDGSSVLIFKRTLLEGVKEVLSFDCKVDKNANGKVSLFMSYDDSKNKNNTEKLINKLEDFTVSYKRGTDGKIVGDKFEKVKYGKSPSGIKIVPDAGYKLVGFICNSDVLLKNKKVIQKGVLIEADLLKSVIVDKDIVLTANYIKSEKQYTITYLVNNQKNLTEKATKGQKITLKKVTLSKNCTITKWFTNEKMYNSGDVVLVNKNMTFIGDTTCISKNNDSNNVKVNKDIYEDSTKHSNKLVIVIMSIIIVFCLIALFEINKKNKYVRLRK